MSSILKPFGRLFEVGDDRYITEFFAVRIEIDGREILFMFSVWNKQKDKILEMLKDGKVRNNTMHYFVSMTLKEDPILNIFKPEYPALLKIDSLYRANDLNSYVIVSRDMTIYSVTEMEEDGNNDYLYVVNHTDKYNDLSDILPEDFSHKETEIVMRLLYVCLSSRDIEKDCALIIKEYVSRDFNYHELMKLMNICTYFSL